MSIIAHGGLTDVSDAWSAAICDEKSAASYRVQHVGVKPKEAATTGSPSASLRAGSGDQRGKPQGRPRTESHLWVLPDAEGATIGGYVPIVFFEAAGEAVVPVAIANKIKELCVVGVQRRFQGSFFPGLPIGPGGNPGKR